MTGNLVVLAYSGGLDTSVSVQWIKEKYGADVITMCLDVGQQKDLKAIEEKAKKIGAIKHYSIDAKEEFVKNYIFPAIKANGLYEGEYPLSSALSRPLIASELVEISKIENADGVAHGCTGKGNDQVRFEVTINSLSPGLKIIAPIREWDLDRPSEIAYAKKHGIPIPVDVDSPYSTDQNLWGRSIECGVLELPDHEPPSDVFEWTNTPEDAPDEPEYVSIEFENGVPISVSGKKMNGVDLLFLLNKIAGKHGIGRIDMIEDRLVGIKSREVYECPAATIILKAHKDLERMVLTKHEVYFKEIVDSKWAQLIYTGLWWDPLKNALDAFIDVTQERVIGEVRLKLFKGNVSVVGRSSPVGLYDPELATYEPHSTFDQKASEGFIKLWGLPTSVATNIIKKAKKKEE